MKPQRPLSATVLLLLMLLPIEAASQAIPVPARPEAADTLSTTPPDTSSTLDYRVLKTLQQGRTEGWNSHWMAVSNSFLLAPAVPIGFAVGGACTSNAPLRRNLLYADALESLGAYALCLGVTLGIKSLVERPRPWVAYEGDLVCLQPVRTSSFPSGHTSTAFVTATSLTLMCPRWYVAAPAYLWAGTVAFSRLYMGAHYPTDVLAGAVIGAGCALLAHAVRGRLCQEHPELYPADAVVVPLTLTF